MIRAKRISLGKVITTIKLIDARNAPDIEKLKEEASLHKHRKPYKRHSKPRVIEKKEHHIEWERKALECINVDRDSDKIGQVCFQFSDEMDGVYIFGGHSPLVYWDEKNGFTDAQI